MAGGAGGGNGGTEGRLTGCGVWGVADLGTSRAAVTTPHTPHPVIRCSFLGRGIPRAHRGAPADRWRGDNKVRKAPSRIPGRRRFPARRSECGAKAKPDEFVLKLRGFEVLNEDVSLAEAGAIEGSIFLVTYRRRRPVR